MRALLLSLLLLASSLPAQRWAAETLMTGVGADFQAGEEVKGACQSDSGMVYSSPDRGSIAFEGKPGQIWRVTHTLSFDGDEAMFKGLKASIAVLKNASGLDGKKVANQLGRALSAAK